MGKQRRSVPRFRRTEDKPPVALTDDDYAILKQVGRHRFLRTTHLYRLFPDRSPDKLSRRLARLYRAGFLDRPRSQIDVFRGEGSQPLVYGLDNAGARILAQREGGTNAGSVDMRGRNRAYTRDNLDHTLATAQFLVDVEVACRSVEHVEFIHGDALAPPTEHASRWDVVLPWQGSRATVSLAPDAVFGLRVHSHDTPPKRAFYFVEIDRGHMTIAPSARVRSSEAFLYRSSVLRKLLAYAVSHQEQAHCARFDIPAARILMLTTSAGRADEMRVAAASLVLPHLPVPPALFLFGAAPEPFNLFAPSFTDASGCATALVPASVP